MKPLFKLLPLSLTVLFAGCQLNVINAPTEVKAPQASIAKDDPQWQAHLKALTNIHRYASKGQFGYISTSPKERFSSYFDWQYQTASQFSLSLSSNLSSKTLKLQRSAQGLTISDEKGRTRTESDVNGLMEEIIGVAFPIDQFAFWLKGLPTQGSDYVINEKRQLAQFSYPLNNKVWQAKYVEYHEDRQPNLPKLIVLENGVQTLKIRIDEWAF